LKLNIGQLVGRLEDTRFITGSGCYTDDEGVGGGLRDAFLRVTRAHARLRSIDYRVAETAPRGRLVPSKADLDADQIDEFRCQVHFENFDGNKTQ
jgi:Aerobic-type carbon monoxide dehydrogenase, large subunit CoxL/CutL homologs